MRKVISITFSLLFLLGVSLTSCISNDPIEEETGNGGSNESNEIITEDIRAEDILIVYFSRSGGNYPNKTYLTVGRTAGMGGYIRDYTGGTVYEIVPTVPYPDEYEDMLVVSRRETANNECPAIANPLENLDNYKVVFIGSPVWYNAPPMIMRTFYETYDLSDKIIIPFGTHEGSGISSCTALSREYFPNTELLGSFGVRGQNINDSRTEVEQWIERIGIPQQQ